MGLYLKVYLKLVVAVLTGRYFIYRYLVTPQGDKYAYSTDWTNNYNKGYNYYILDESRKPYKISLEDDKILNEQNLFYYEYYVQTLTKSKSSSENFIGLKESSDEFKLLFNYSEDEKYLRAFWWILAK